MNVERISRLADALEDEDIQLGFYMGDVTCRMARGVKDPSSFDDVCDSLDLGVTDVIPCDTAACIAGWACLLFGEPGDQVTMRTAGFLLDVWGEEARNLFLGRWAYPTRLPSITRKEAIEHLRQLVTAHQPPVKG